MRRWLALWLLGILLTGVSGCKTTDPDDEVSARPWNAPKDWETGLPSGLYERR